MTFTDAKLDADFIGKKKVEVDIAQYIEAVKESKGILVEESGYTVYAVVGDLLLYVKGLDKYTARQLSKRQRQPVMA